MGSCLNLWSARGLGGISLTVLLGVSVGCDRPGAEVYPPWSDLGIAMGLERDSVTVAINQARFTDAAPSRGVSLSADASGSLSRVSVSAASEEGSQFVRRWLTAAPGAPICFDVHRSFIEGRIAVWEVAGDRVWFVKDRVQPLSDEDLTYRVRLGWGVEAEVPHLSKPNAEVAEIDCEWLEAEVARLANVEGA